jgi:hypothetical protein
LPAPLADVVTFATGRHRAQSRLFALGAPDRGLYKHRFPLVMAAKRVDLNGICQRLI